MKKIFAFITALIMLFTVNVCADEAYSSETEEPYVVESHDVGYGITVYKNSDGKWGAYSTDFYLEANYYLPCEYYYFDTYSAYDGTFTLALENHTAISEAFPQQTYYVFNSKGEVIKTFTYTLAGVQADKPNGCTFSFVIAGRALGSNIVFEGMPAYYKSGSSGVLMPYIKRLYSEKVAGEGYSYIFPYPGVGFAAKETSTDQYCVLNPDGTFKEYLTYEDMYDEDGNFKKYPH